MEGMSQAAMSQANADVDRWKSSVTDCGPAGRAPTTSAKPRTMPPGEDPGERARLSRTIETQIIPRLMLAHRARERHVIPAEAFQSPAVAVDVATFAALALAQDGAGVSAYVDALLKGGVTLEALCRDLIAPAARQLGEWWERDECDFAQVTLGLWCLQRVLRDKSASFSTQLQRSGHGLRVLLAPAPGEQHTLGISMVMEFFCRAGWDVAGGAATTVAELCGFVASTWFDVVGMSVSCETRIDTVTDALRAVRKASLNRCVTVLIGGPLLALRHDLADIVGADLAIEDAAEAPERARRFCADYAG